MKFYMLGGIISSLKKIKFYSTIQFINNTKLFNKYKDLEDGVHVIDEYEPAILIIVVLPL